MEGMFFPFLLKIHMSSKEAEVIGFQSLFPFSAQWLTCKRLMVKMDSAKCNQRDIVFFLWKEGISGAEITIRLHSVFGNDALGKTAVYKWIGRFSDGWNATDDAPRSGRPRSSTTDENVQKAQAIIDRDRRATVRDIAEELGMGSATAHSILVNDLQLTKLCARWIPRLLTATQMEARVIVAKANLKRADKDPNFLERLLTVDETWIHHFDPESREQSKQWLTRGCNPPLKAKVVPSLGKVMATVFWDASGIVHIDYLERGVTINAEYYSNLLQNDVRSALRRKRPGKLSSTPLLLHDNARPHTAKRTLEVVENLGWEILLHPPYSPDLAPSDFHLFPSLKKDLRGVHFETLQEMKEAVTNWTKRQSPNFFIRGLEKLLDRYETCVDLCGDYVEKCGLVDDDT
jgi:histone-lysine N-methyltransferase SETMAR